MEVCVLELSANSKRRASEIESSDENTFDPQELDEPNETGDRKYIRWLILNLSVSRLGIAAIQLGLAAVVFPLQAAALLGEDSNLKPLLSGLLSGVMGVVGLLFGPLTGKVSDKVGHRQIFILVGGLIGSAFLLGMSAWTDASGLSAWALIVMAALAQIGLDGTFVCAESLASAVLPFREFCKCNALKGVFQTVGEIVGQIVATLLLLHFPTRFWYTYLFLAGFLLVTLVPTVFFTSPRTAPARPSTIVVVTSPDTTTPQAAHPAKKHHRRTLTLILLSRFFIWSNVFCYFAFLQYIWSSVFSKGASAPLYTMVHLVVISFFGLLAVFPGAYLARRTTPKFTCLVSFLISLLHSLLNIFATRYLVAPLMWAGAVLAGVGWGLNLSAEPVLLVQCAPDPTQMGVDFGLLSAVSNLAVFFAPTISGILISALQSASVTLRAAALYNHVISLAYALLAIIFNVLVRPPRVPPQPPPAACPPCDPAPLPLES